MSREVNRLVRPGNGRTIVKLFGVALVLATLDLVPNGQASGSPIKVSDLRINQLLKQLIKMPSSILRAERTREKAQWL